MQFVLIYSLLLFARFLSQLSAEPEPGVYKNQVFDTRIKTVQIYKEGWNLSYPVIRLNSTEKMVFQFDLLGDHNESFYYTFFHCDKDWNKTGILTTDYLDGFPENPIEDYKPSFNTTTTYTHYKLIFPNDRINIKLSGNYILYVYQADEPEKPAVTQRFIVSEDVIHFDMNVHRPGISSTGDAGQQIDFTVDITRAAIIDPFRNIYTSILQNGRWDNARNNIKPGIYGANELKYSSLSEENIFMAGNEFRYFDIKSIKYQSENVRRIDFMTPYYNFYLAPSDNREYKPYFYWQDFNGKYYIANQEGRDPETDADYVYVYFTLPSAYKAEGGDLYIFGGLTNWSFSKDNRMTYNPEKRQYECSLLLKQGWYNYEYAFLKPGEGTCTDPKFEGSHFETENDYIAIVYYRNPRGRYDRVIGTGSVNTLNRISY